MEAVLFLHLFWSAWVLLGWLVTRCRPLLRTLHIASLIYAIVIELVPRLLCPLTVATAAVVDVLAQSLKAPLAREARKGLGDGHEG